MLLRPGRFRDTVSWDTITVSAVDSEHRVSTYRLPARSEVRGHGAADTGVGPGQPGTQDRRGSRVEPGKDAGRKDGDMYIYLYLYLHLGLLDYGKNDIHDYSNDCFWV